MDYKFLTIEEFSALEKNGSLLESGVFDGKLGRILKAYNSLGRILLL